MSLSPASSTPVPRDLQLLLQDSAVLMALFDPEDRLRCANAAFVATFHPELAAAPTWAEMLRANYHHQRGTNVSAADFEAWLASAKSRRGKLPFRGFEADLHDGRWLWMTETMQPDGWMLCIATDISQLKASEHAMRHARDAAVEVANTDALTGIGNRRHVLLRLDQMLASLHEPGERLCVVVADLDRFKSINDRLGHPAGDVFLKDFARRAQHLLRATDTVGRVGGEEFMMLLPSLGSGQAEKIIDRLHAEVRLARPLALRPDDGYTFSAGIADAQRGESLEAVFRRADAALYQAKSDGRNRTVCA
ncbi:MAG: diguanylate cyclase [Rhodoferax sp.]|nr:diguanylate cyclase [Rhodoferax sp.]